MPSIADALGWKEEIPSFGRSLFRSVGSRCAVVANNAHAGAVTKWAVVTADRKAVIACQNQVPWEPRIVDLYDLQDQRVNYGADPAKCVDTFDAILRFEKNVTESAAWQANRQ
jgi:hypothetical protein